MTRKTPPRPASSFPPEFARLFRRVLETGEPIIINNLGNERRFYTNFRASVNRWRKAYYTEAMESGNAARIKVAEDYYGVSLSNPSNEGGQWHLVVQLADSKLGNKIAELLPPEKTTIADEDIPQQPGIGGRGSEAISQLYGGEDEEDNN